MLSTYRAQIAQMHSPWKAQIAQMHSLLKSRYCTDTLHLKSTDCTDAFHIKSTARTDALHLKSTARTARTDALHLKSTDCRNFQRSGIHIFITITPKNLGDLIDIRIWHDNEGGDWYLNRLNSCSELYPVKRSSIWTLHDTIWGVSIISYVCQRFVSLMQ